MAVRPRLLVLGDDEGRIAAAPAMARLRELAEVTVLDRPLGDADLEALAGVRVLLAIRERTPIDAALLARLPDLELVLQTGGHAYHVDQEAATGRGVVVALSRRATMASASVPELTFGLMLAVLRRIHPLAAELAAGAGPGGRCRRCPWGGCCLCSPTSTPWPPSWPPGRGRRPWAAPSPVAPWASSG